WATRALGPAPHPGDAARGPGLPRGAAGRRARGGGRARGSRPPRAGRRARRVRRGELLGVPPDGLEPPLGPTPTRGDRSDARRDRTRRRPRARRATRSPWLHATPRGRRAARRGGTRIWHAAVALRARGGAMPDYDRLRYDELASISEFLHGLSDDQWD